MTNAEWMRSMTEQELAIWLCQISMCTYCEFAKYCSREGNGTGEWLQQEHKENGND